MNPGIEIDGPVFRQRFTPRQAVDRKQKAAGVRHNLDRAVLRFFRFRRNTRRTGGKEAERQQSGKGKFEDVCSSRHCLTPPLPQSAGPLLPCRNGASSPRLRLPDRFQTRAMKPAQELPAESVSESRAAWVSASNSAYRNRRSHV